MIGCAEELIGALTFAIIAFSLFGAMALFIWAVTK